LYCPARHASHTGRPPEKTARCPAAHSWQSNGARGFKAKPASHAHALRLSEAAGLVLLPVHATQIEFEGSAYSFSAHATHASLPTPAFTNPAAHAAHGPPFEPVKPAEHAQLEMPWPLADPSTSE